MKTHETHATDVAELYGAYRRSRDSRPRADMTPMLAAARGSDADAAHRNADTHMQWPEDESSAEITALYREYKSKGCSVSDMSDIRGRVINNTLKIARVHSENVAGAASAVAPAVPAGESMISTVRRWFGMQDGGLGFMPAAAAAVLVAALLVATPWQDGPGLSSTDLASVVPMTNGLVDQASDLLPFVQTAPEASFGFSKSTSHPGRVFGMGVGAVDLVMALRSGSADKTLEVTRNLAGLSSDGNLKELNESASQVINEVKQDPTVSPVVFTRSMDLLNQMRAVFSAGDERAVFELGQWVEAVYLTSERVIVSGNTSSLDSTLANARTHLENATGLKNLSPAVINKLGQLAAIEVADGIELSEARLARDLAVGIKTLVE